MQSWSLVIACPNWWLSNITDTCYHWFSISCVSWQISPCWDIYYINLFLKCPSGLSSLKIGAQRHLWIFSVQYLLIEFKRANMLIFDLIVRWLIWPMLMASTWMPPTFQLQMWWVQWKQFHLQITAAIGSGSNIFLYLYEYMEYGLGCHSTTDRSLDIVAFKCRTHGQQYQKKQLCRTHLQWQRQKLNTLRCTDKLLSPMHRFWSRHWERNHWSLINLHFLGCCDSYCARCGPSGKETFLEIFIIVICIIALHLCTTDVLSLSLSSSLTSHLM